MKETRSPKRAKSQVEEERVEPCFSLDDRVNGHERYCTTEENHSFDDAQSQIKGDHHQQCNREEVCAIALKVVEHGVQEDAWMTGLQWVNQLSHQTKQRYRLHLNPQQRGEYDGENPSDEFQHEDNRIHVLHIELHLEQFIIVLVDLELFFDFFQLFLKFSVYLSLLKEALSTIDLFSLPLQFLTLTKQSDRFHLQKLGDLRSIRSSAELWPIQKLDNQRYWQDCKATSPAASENWISQQAKEGNNEANETT